MRSEERLCELDSRDTKVRHFCVMWQEYYDKMSDEDKNMLPLKRIAFLGNNE